MTGTENLSNFRCSKPEFDEYLRVQALYDQNEHMGQTIIFIHEQQIVGYVVLAMAHMPSAERTMLKIDSHGSVPVLLVSHLATHKQYERRNIGRNMLLWPINYAKEISHSIGCRAVLVKSHPDVVEFYQKNGFVHASTETSSPNTLYFDIKQK